MIAPVFADTRQSHTITGYTANTLIKRGDWKVYRITYIATSNGGNFSIHDTLDTGTTDSANVKTEGSEATSLNGKPMDFTNFPLEGSTGLYLTISNATVIVEYD